MKETNHEPVLDTPPQSTLSARPFAGKGLDTLVRALRIEGPLDEARLTQALSQTVQPLTSKIPGHPEILEGSHDAPALAALIEATRQSLSAEAQPWRALLVRHSVTDRTLIFCAHPSVFDQGSFPLLARGLSQSYQNLEVPKGLFPDPQNLETRPTPSPGEDYLRSLTGIPTTLEFPLSGPRKSPMSVTSGEVWGTWENQAEERMAAMAIRFGVPPLVVASAAAGYILTRFTGQNRFLLGMPFSRRQDAGGPLGPLTATLPVAFDAGSGTTFETLVTAWSTALTGASSQAPSSFQDIVQRLDIPADPAIHPMFQVACSTEEPFLPTFPGCTGHPLFVAPPPQQLDLSILFSTTGFRVVYSDQIIAKDQAEALSRSLGAFFDAALANPDRPLTELPWIGAADRQTLVVALNNTRTPEFLTKDLLDLIQGPWETWGDRIALKCRDKVLTYAQLGAMVEAMDTQLRSAEGHLVGIALPRSVEMVAAMVAVLRSGKAYVPLDPAFPPDRLNYMIDHSRLTTIITTSTLRHQFEGSQVTCLEVDRPLPWASVASAVPVSPEAPAYVIYTSGSTGNPKGVSVSRGALANFLQSMIRTPGIGPEDRWCAVTTLSFDIAELELLGPLCVGATVLLATQAEAKDPRALSSLLAHGEATILQATPVTWQMLCASGWAGSPRLKALCGGEALVPSLVKHLLPKVGSLWNMYGPTETTVWSTCVPILDEVSPISVGRPIANTAVYVLDDQGRSVPPGVEGQLYIGGDGVSLGYLHDPELTQKRFTPDPFRQVGRMYDTGDRAKFDPTGRLFIVGRSDFQVKVRGYRIELGEIEARLATFPEMGQVVAVVRKDDHENPELVAYYTGPTEFSVKALRKHCGSSLPAYMIPTHFKRLEAFPQTPNGKIDRRALPRPSATPKAQDLRGQLASILGEETLNPQLSFIDHGGDSLSFIRASRAIEKSLGWLPVGWETEPLGTLLGRHAQDKRTLMGSIETSILVRALAILTVVLAHFGIIYIVGPNTILFVIAGWSLGTLQLQKVVKDEKVWAFLKTAIAMIVPTTLINLFNMVLAGQGFDLPTLFMVNTYDDTTNEGGYWFINVLSQIYLLLAVVFLIPAVRRIVRSHTFLAVLGACVGFLVFSGYHFFVQGGNPIKTPLQELWLVLLGIAVALAKTNGQKLPVAFLILFTTWEELYWNTYSLFPPLALLLVLFIPRVKVPKALGIPFTLIAGASLYIYLTHEQIRAFFLWLSDSLHVPLLGKASMALMAALVGGILVWKAWDQGVSWVRVQLRRILHRNRP